MNLLRALLDTYNNAEQQGLIDVSQSVLEPCILPLYHDSKRATGKNDIFEVTLNHEGEYVSSRFLQEKEYIIFPVSESSMNRTSGAAPHVVSDEVGYVTKTNIGSKKDGEKYQLYINELNDFLQYAKAQQMPCVDIEIIYKYVQKGTLLSDLAKFVVGSESYSLKQYELIYNKDGKEQKLNLEKIFVTFAIDDPRRGVISLSRNRELHEIYRAYVTNKNKSEEQDYCDISGERTYCSIRHKGVTGKAK